MTSDLEMRKYFERLVGQFWDQFFYLPFAKQLKKQRPLKVRRVLGRDEIDFTGDLQVQLDDHWFYVDEKIDLSGQEDQFSFLISYYEFSGRKHLKYSNLFDSITKSTHYLLVWPVFKNDQYFRQMKVEDISECSILLMKKDDVLLLLEEEGIDLDWLYQKVLRLRRLARQPIEVPLQNRQKRIVPGISLVYQPDKRSQPLFLSVDRSRLMTRPHLYCQITSTGFTILSQEGRLE